ncbi:hypothetical protein MKX01_015241 [Papaver californicum]|nr:hypothetical protein MKX01_015241 [Papaver californicum]
MATISFAKSAAVMNISGSFPQSPSICTSSSSVSFREVSRVGFSSYSSFNPKQDRNIAAKEMKCRASEDSLVGQAGVKINEGVAKATELADSAKAKAAEDIETTSAKSGELQADAKDIADSLKDNIAEGTEKATESASKLGESVKEGVLDAGEKAKENANTSWEATKDATQNIKEAFLGKE